MFSRKAPPVEAPIRVDDDIVEQQTPSDHIPTVTDATSSKDLENTAEGLSTEPTRSRSVTSDVVPLSVENGQSECSPNKFTTVHSHSTQ